MFPFKDNLRAITRPTATAVLIIVNCVCFLIQQAFTYSGGYWGASVLHYGSFRPADFTQAFASADPLAMLLGICSIFTSMFMHGGIMHILGNMVYLNCFGRAVEARLGQRQYVCFYLLGGIAAVFGQYLFNPFSAVPYVGASGAIAGVLSAYMLLLPKPRLSASRCNWASSTFLPGLTSSVGWACRS